jgi:hypothetical protein
MVGEWLGSIEYIRAKYVFASKNTMLARHYRRRIYRIIGRGSLMYDAFGQSRAPSSTIQFSARGLKRHTSK